jgi:hypothetical protein
MTQVMVMKFGKKSMVPHVTYTNGIQDVIPKFNWDEEIWIERGEDWYVLETYKKDKKKKDKVVLIIERQQFLMGLMSYPI